MNKNDIHKQQPSQEPQTKRYMVIVPQEFVQVFYVDAQSPDEATELVRDRHDDSEDGDINISSSDSSFVQDAEEKHWFAEESN